MLINTINTAIKYYKHITQGSPFNLASVSVNSILTILKSTQVSKAAALDSLSGCFLKDGAKILAKPISDLCNLSINSEKFPVSCRVAKLRPLYKKRFLNSVFQLQTHIFVTPNIESYRKSHSRSSKYVFEFKKFITHSPI